MRKLVHVRDRPVEIDVYLKLGTKSVWIAKGEFQDKYHEVKRTTASAAARAWVQAARYHS